MLLRGVEFVRQFTIISLFLCLAGCSRIEPQFQTAESIQQLPPVAQPAVQGLMSKYFGTPTQMQVWEKLPLRHSGATGEVVEPILDDSDSVIGVNVMIADQAWPIESGQRLAWLKSDPTTGGTMTVKSYDPQTGDLLFTSSLPSGFDSPSTGGATPTTLRFAVDPGAVLESGRHLYAEHCLHCHGVSGDGAGPTAPYLNPRPRDYRQAKFKFTSTGVGAPASRDDLARIVTDGIPGTYMPSFKLLDPKEKAAIVEYVRWLSMRGQAETYLANQTDQFTEASIDRRLDETVSALKADDPRRQNLATRSAEYQAQRDELVKGLNAIPEGERAADRKKIEESLANLATAHRDHRYSTVPQEFTDSLTNSLDDFLKGDVEAVIAQPWLDAEAEEGIVLPITPRVEPTPESIERGRQIFLGSIADCKKCHGPAGLGDGEQTLAVEFNKGFVEPGLHDDWGNLVAPRNLRSGIFRGGRRPIDLYRRLKIGIKGTPMAGFATLIRPVLDENGLPTNESNDEDLWHVVNYVLHLPHEKITLGEEIVLPAPIVPVAPVTAGDAAAVAAPPAAPVSGPVAN